MSRRFCVAYIDFFENCIEQAIVVADNWKEAIVEFHIQRDGARDEGYMDWIASMADELEEFRGECANGECDYSVVEIPDD